jgi:hypothetical protein
MALVSRWKINFMPKKTKIIFISAFLITILIILGVFFWINRNKTATNGVTPWYQSFNPFGTGGSTTVTTDTNGNVVDENGNIVENTGITNGRFHQITGFAIAGATFLEETRPIDTTNAVVSPETILPTQPKFEQAPSIRYVEKKTGHIYKMFLDTKIKEKISNSTIPSIYEALFDGTGESVIYRYLSEDNTINSFMATLGAKNGEFLPQNISDISTSLDKSKFFYLTKGSNGASGTVGTFKGTGKNIVFNHPFTEWTSQWDNKQNVYLTTKPSYNVTGSIFILNTANKTILKIFGGIQGLTTLINPNGSLVLYSYTTSTGPKLGVFNISEHSTIDFDTYGLPEKCVWASDNINVYCAVPNVITGNQYPDSWYQGLVSFDDFFVKINTTTGEKETIANGTDETPIDGTYLFLDKKETSLFFTNKKDSTLWSLDL